MECWPFPARSLASKRDQSMVESFRLDGLDHCDKTQVITLCVTSWKVCWLKRWKLNLKSKEGYTQVHQFRKVSSPSSKSGEIYKLDKRSNTNLCILEAHKLPWCINCKSPGSLTILKEAVYKPNKYMVASTVVETHPYNFNLLRFTHKFNIDEWVKYMVQPLKKFLGTDEQFKNSH